MAEASAGEVLVSSVMTELVSGSGFAFTDRGVHRLKGIEGYWHLFAVSAVEGEPRAPASEPDVAARIRQEIEPTPLAKRRWMRMAVPSLAVLLVAVTALVLTNRPHPVELRADSLARSILRRTKSSPTLRLLQVPVRSSSCPRTRCGF
jgi:hypothetical protein